MRVAWRLWGMVRHMPHSPDRYLMWHAMISDKEHACTQNARTHMSLQTKETMRPNLAQSKTLPGHVSGWALLEIRRSRGKKTGSNWILSCSTYPVDRDMERPLDRQCRWRTKKNLNLKLKYSVGQGTPDSGHMEAAEVEIPVTNRDTVKGQGFVCWNSHEGQQASSVSHCLRP